MNEGRLWLCAAALLCASLPESAMALGFIRLPASGWAFVGTVHAETLLGFSRDGGVTCQWWRLNGDGGLVDDWQINGSAGNDFMYAVDTTFEFCGVTIGPLNADNHELQFQGLGGHDIINGGNTATNIQGGDGNDNLQGRHSRLVIFGGAGNDVMFGHSSTAVLSGGDGDDIACATHATRTVTSMFGGDENTGHPGDRRCGRGTMTTDDWESSSCAAPCF